MSLFTRRGRVDVSNTESELDSIASSGGQSPDEMIEELARMALAGRYHGSPMTYETNEMLRGHGLARRPRSFDHAAPLSSSSSAPASAAGPSPALLPHGAAKRTARATRLSSLPSSSSRSPSAHPSLPPHQVAEALSTGRAPAAAAARGGRREEGPDDELSRALQRMYRRLVREYAAEMQEAQSDEAGGAAADGGDGESMGDEGKEKKKTAAASASGKPQKRRKTDEAALSRLLAKSKTQELRQAVPYHKIKDREEEARKHPKRVRVPQKAVILGRRLYLEAQEKRRTVEELQAEQEKQREEQEKKACTFHPSISRYAARLAAREGYYALEDRLVDQAARDEETQRRRLERAVEQEKECTFHPTLSPHTREIVAEQRRQHSRSHSSSAGRQQRHQQRRGRSASSASSSPSSTHEPFEPGERLYRDGAERLLRQQIRQRRAAAREQRAVVGGHLRLSSAESRDMVQRFEAWATSRDERQAELRRTVERQTREGSAFLVKSSASPLSRSATVLNRSPSARSATTTAAAAAEAVSPSARPQRERPSLSREDVEGSALRRSVTQAPPAPPSPAAPALRDDRRPSGSAAHNSLRGGFAGSAAVPLAFSVPTTSKTTSLSGGRGAASPPSSPSSSPSSSASSSSSTTATTTSGLYWTECPPPPIDAEARKAQLRTRLGALFYKYAVSPTTVTVSLAEVQERVRRYYPEDSGVAAALAPAVASEAQRLSKAEFMAALAQYVAQHGPQPWCLPASVCAARTHRVKSRRARPPPREAETARAVGRVSPRAGGSSTTREQRQVHRRPSSAQSGEAHRGRAATPEEASGGQAQTPVTAGTSGAPNAVAAPSPSRVERPLRTHIYNCEPRSASSPPSPAAVAPAAGLVQVDAETIAEKASAPRAAPAASAPRRSLTPAATPRARKAQHAPAPATKGVRSPQQRRRPPAHALGDSDAAAGAAPGPSTAHVRGYENHVARYRRSSHDGAPSLSASRQRSASGAAKEKKAAKTTTTTMRRAEENEEMRECTFHPVLDRHSVVLSDRNLEKRTRYARELQQRREELQRMREAVLRAAGGEGGSATCAPALSLRPPNATTAVAATTTTAAPTKGKQKTAPAVLSGRSPLGGQSPTLDVSSTSSATAAAERSAATSWSTPQRLSASRDGVPLDASPLFDRPAAGGSGAAIASPSRRARSPGTDVKTHAVPASLSPSPTSQAFRTTKPARAILDSDDEEGTPRRLTERQLQLGEAAC